MTTEGKGRAFSLTIGCNSYLDRERKCVTLSRQSRRLAVTFAVGLYGLLGVDPTEKRDKDER